jgi:hypothetical protein
VILSPHGPQYKCVQYGKDDAYTSLEMLPADARLTAAAPDLLAAAQTVLAGLDARIRHAKDSTPVFEGIAALHDAIAKATASRRD